ncbi:hypothetical protein [Amycolatopsis taiwanensis]|uniref:Uncharacterized protein n=1 Tax=Amycolatopsis taiwanensis TaxID=342230 RepID=A0A9W6VJB7_9PSEU|nr:hypothetical protein [Amycolatopsis taiwanensis]GLY70550.1 hypothetical protein Atai01_71690 [Amycolatopsis taiwanensis]
MTDLDVPRARADLVTVRSALLAAAEAEAAACVAEAERASDVVLGRAQVQANQIHREAEAAGRADAELRNAIERRQARRQARRTELATQRAIYDELHRRVRDALARLVVESDLRTRLAARARRVLGAEAALVDVPGDGLVGRAGEKYLDLGLDAMTARAIEGLGERVRELWEA